MKVLVGGLAVLSFSPPAAVDAQAVCGHSEAVFLALALAHTAAASPPGGASTTTQLSRQTQEWWRWVLVQIYDSSSFLPDGDDQARQAFVDLWRPDIFDWGGDQRWNVQEWARLHGIAVAAGGGMEYEEASFYNKVYVNQTWGIEGGLAVNNAGRMPGGGPPNAMSPYMTHAAPKWHATVTQGHFRHSRAYIGDSIVQDNCDVMSFAHGGPDMGWGPWEERLFANSSLSKRFGLPANFSVRLFFHHRPPPANDSAAVTRRVEILRAFAEWAFLLWRDAWRDLAETSRHLARVAGMPVPAVRHCTPPPPPSP
jgi:hypothetical protein